MMIRAHATIPVISLIAATLVVTLAGCEPTLPPPSAEPSSAVPTAPETAVETPTPAPTPTPTSTELNIPDCKKLITLAQAKSILGPTTVFLGASPANRYSPWFDVPAVSTAITGVTVGRACWWGVRNSDVSFYVFVAEIDPTTRSSIDAALTTEGFSTAVVGAETVRGKGSDDGRAEVQQFDGKLWILSDGNDLDITGIAADTAFESVRAANPSLGL